MTERERFEKFMRDRMFIKSDFRQNQLGQYKEYYMQAHWEVWQAASAAPQAGHCIEGDRCVCGGDTPRVRAACGNWREPAAAPVASAAPAQEPGELTLGALLERLTGQVIGEREARTLLNGDEIELSPTRLMAIINAARATHPA